MSTAATDQNFANLVAQAAQNESVEQSAITVLANLVSQLTAAEAAANNGDSAAIPSVIAGLSATQVALAAAIAAVPGGTVSPAGAAALAAVK